MLADKGFPVCRPYGQTHHPTGDKDQGDRAGAGRHAAEAGRRTAQREHRRGPQKSGRIPASGDGVHFERRWCSD